MIASSANFSHPARLSGAATVLCPCAEDVVSQVSPGVVTDELTGLLSRSAFQDALAGAIEMQSSDAEIGLLIINLDGFKTVNQVLGHATGDRLLKAVARRLSRLVEGAGLVGRLGSDEFAIAQINSPQPSSSRGLASEIAARLCEPFHIGDQIVGIGVSIGTALAPYDGVEVSSLLRSADLALSRAKSDGRGMLRHFEPEMEDRIQRRHGLETELRQAIASEQFQLHYQPIMGVQGARIVTFEALVRWLHPVRGLMRPDLFIPLAEETGLITPLGHWILRSACREAMRWGPDIRLAVNLSPVQLLDRRFVDSVVAALQETGLPAKRLEFEITESALLVDSELILGRLRQLRELGIQIALDDFGTGYSSISYLQRFPFDRIKIDRSFVSGADQNKESAAIVRMIASLGTALGVFTTAEGVETAEELHSIRQAGCTEIQGYLFSRPLPAGDIPELIAHYRRLTEPILPARNASAKLAGTSA